MAKTVTIQTVWVLHLYYPNEDRDPCVTQYYFSTEANAKQYLAHAIFDFIENKQDLQSIFSFSPYEEGEEANLEKVQSRILQLGIRTNENIQILLCSHISANIIDEGLLRYRIPPPNDTFDFDGICGTLREFSAYIQQPYSQDDSQDIKDFIATFEKMLVFQTYLKETHQGEDMWGLGVQSALTHANRLLQDA